MNPDNPNDHVDLPPDFVIHLTESQPRLFGFLLKRLARREQALEVLQNVNLTICRKSNDFTPGTDFMAWAFTIARFQVLAFHQNQARDKLVFSPELLNTLDSLDEQKRDHDNLEERKHALKRCLGKLRDEHRELVVRRYAEAMSVNGLAGELGRTANSISILLHRIREQLMDCIKQDLSRGNNE
ncbi:MAG: sigma-70 family RNA polymerase sigma factor [Mariniblastus sp.]